MNCDLEANWGTVAVDAALVSCRWFRCHLRRQLPRALGKIEKENSEWARGGKEKPCLPGMPGLCTASQFPTSYHCRHLFKSLRVNILSTSEWKEGKHDAISPSFQSWPFPASATKYTYIQVCSGFVILQLAPCHIMKVRERYNPE